jgi:chitin synthase
MVEALIYDENINYHVVKLAKEMHTRALDGKEVLSLKRAHGLLAVPDPLNSNPQPEDSEHSPFPEGSILARYHAETSKSTRCDFFILVTMYNEGIEEFSNTLSGIIDNMESFLTAGIDLKHIVCVFIVDGMKTFNSTFSKFKSFFENYFVVDEITEKFKVEDLVKCKLKDETEHDEFAHCFEQKLRYQNNPKVFLNLIFCVKQKNKRKLNSHLWFFGGFCPHFHPTYVMLIDVGTVPNYESLFLLYEAMATDPRIAGCTGELRPLQRTIFDRLIGYQVVEYKLNGIFERTFESVTGLITYLPSTFSAYRWDALQGEPLWSNYFLSILYPEKLNLVNANIYLTGDRMLSYAIFTQKQSNYLFRFVRGATADTDVPESFPVLMYQRRRWINGTFFGIYHLFKNYSKLIRTNHSWFRKVIFTFQLSYIMLSVINNWIIVASLYLFISISIRTAIGLNRSLAYDPGNIVMQFYMFLLVMIVIMSYGTKPERIETYMKWIYIAFTAFIFISIMTTLYSLNLTKYPDWVFYAFIAVLLCFVVGSTLHFSIATLLKYMFHYICAYPTFINVLNIYAVCNIHEVTWGSRPDFPTTEERKRTDEYEHHRTRWVILWVVSNVGYYALVMATSNDTGMYYLYVTMAIITIIYSIKFVGSIVYLFQEWFCRKKLSKVKNLDKIINNRNQAIKLQKKNKKRLEKSFSIRTKKAKIHAESIIMQTECDSKEKKESTVKIDDLKVSSATIFPAEASIKKESEVVNQNLYEEEKVPKKPKKEKKSRKKPKKEKKEKKEKKGKKGKYEKKMLIDLEESPKPNQEKEKNSLSHSEVYDFSQPAKNLPLNEEKSPSSKPSVYALAHQWTGSNNEDQNKSALFEFDSPVINPIKIEFSEQDLSSESSEDKSENPLPLLKPSVVSPPAELKKLSNNISSRATPIFPVQIDPFPISTESKELIKKDSKKQTLLQDFEQDFSPIKKKGEKFYQDDEFFPEKKEENSFFSPTPEKFVKNTLNKKNNDSEDDSSNSSFLSEKKEIKAINRNKDEKTQNVKPAVVHKIENSNLLDLTPKDLSGFAAGDKKNTLESNRSKFEYNQKEDLSDFSSRLNKPETSFKPKQIDFNKDSKSFKQGRELSDLNENHSKNQEISDFKPKEKGFINFFDGIEDEFQSFNNISSGFKSDLSGFEPAKDIKKGSSKATLKSGLDLTPQSEEKDLFEPGVLADQRYKLSIPIKRLSTMTGLLIKRLREIEEGKKPEAEEAEKIRTAMIELKK